MLFDFKKTTFGVALCTCLIGGAAHATPFTTTSPTSGGELPGGVTEIGGVVFDIIGLNDTRVVSQIAASSLFDGFFDTGSPEAYRGNPGTIGIQTGFDSTVTSQLGGGIKELAVRITVDDGDTGLGDFDEGVNFLLLNGIEIDNFTNVMAQETSSNGQTEVDAPDPGFENNDLETGFFFESDASVLAAFFSSVLAEEEIVVALRDDQDVFDNRFDFTQGLDGSLIDVGSGPVVTPGDQDVPEPAALLLFGAGLAGLGAMRRHRRA